MKSTSKKRTPSIVNLTVKRRYLTQREIERLMDCARKHGRYGHRDATMILVAYRHGLRASEVCDLQWQQIELSEGRLHVHRVKNGIPSVHPIRGDEMRALRKLRRDYPTDAHVFVSERGGPISPIGFHRLLVCGRRGKAGAFKSAHAARPAISSMICYTCSGWQTGGLQRRYDGSLPAS
jgi:integrase